MPITETSFHCLARTFEEMAESKGDILNSNQQQRAENEPGWWAGPKPVATLPHTTG